MNTGIELQALSQPNQQIIQRIRNRNRKEQALIIRPNIVVNKSINTNTIFSRRFPHRGFEVLQSQRQIPYIQSEDTTKREFMFYSRTLRYVYLLIDQQDTQLWKLFKSQYEKIVPQQQRPLLNMVSCLNKDDLDILKYNIDGFISGGVQVRLLISKSISDQTIKEIGQKIKEAGFSEMIVQRKLGNNERFKTIEKITVIYNDLLEKFKQEYKLRIRNSMKKNIRPQHNFVNIDISQSNMFIRKRLLQFCIKAKKIEQQIQIHQKFANYLRTYENQTVANKIVQIIDKKAKGSEDNISIATCKNKIKQIQQEEQKFCQDFKKDLQQIKKNEKMTAEEVKRIYFKVIRQYKNEDSIYEIINSSLRLSMTINENNIKKMSTFIRYMYEAVRYFYKIQVNAKSENLKFETVYRGGVISEDQLKQLKQGQIIKNLGFLSTTTKADTASQFFGKSNPCLFIIDMNRQYLTERYVNNLEGFIVTKQVFQHMKQPEKFKEEEEVIFNPLNIFQVVQVIIQNEPIKNTSFITAYRKLINKQHTYANIVILKYAPQVQLLTKIERGDAQAEKRFNQIKHHISKTIEQKNYDKGRILHERGRNIEALKYYQKAESKAEVLTMQQKQTKINILNNLKEYKKLDAYTKQQVKNLERENQLIQNQTNQMKKSVKIDMLTLMTKRAQILQTARNYASTERFAVDVSKQATKLQMQLQSQIKQTTPLQFMKFLKMDLKASVLLVKSKFQNNDVKFSLNQNYRSFYLVDQVYSSLEKLQIPQITKSVLILPNDDKFANLKEAFKKFEPPMQSIQNQKQSYIKESIKKMKKKKQEKADAEIPQICEKIDFYINPEKSISDRKSKDAVLSIYKALNQKDILQNFNADLKNTMDTLEDLRSTIQQLIKTQNQIHDCYKSNLKATNQNLQVCLKSQKEVLQTRFGKFKQELQKNLDVRLKNQYLNTEFVQEYTRLNDFLIQYKNVDSSKQVENLRKNIKQKLTKKIQDEENLDKSGQVKLTSEKTIMYESHMNQCKASTCNQKILQSIALQRQNKKQNRPILTLSSYKNRKDFEQHYKILQKMTKMHREDEQINNGEHLLKDLNEQLELYINSDDISDSQKQQYKQWIEMCNKKIQQFRQKYLNTLRNSEELVHNYYWVSEVKLKMGQFKQAKKNLQKAKELLVEIYDENSIKSVNRKSVSKSIKQKLEQGTLTKTYARDITIKCYKLEAEIIGVYEQQSVRKKFLVQLQKMKKFVQKNAPDKICPQAQINEAVGFLASRCLFNAPKIKNSQAYIILEAYEESIKLRSSLLGPESEYIAIANCTIALIQNKCQKPNQKIIQSNCKNGMTIFEKLKKQIPDSNPKTTYLERQPNLYLYLMKLQSISNRITRKVDPLSHYQGYIEEFQRNRKDLKSLYIVQVLMSVGTQLSKQQKYKRQSQELLDKCYSQIENIEAMNTIQQGQFRSFAKVKQLACTLLSEVCTGDKQKKFKELMTKIKDYLTLNAPSDPGSVSDSEPKPKPKPPRDNRNIAQYTADMILECIGMYNRRDRSYRQRKDDKK